MNHYFDQFAQSHWVQSIGWALLHSFWQIALIAVLYAIAAIVFRKRTPALRYLLGCIAMAAMLLAPIVTLYVLQNSIRPVASEFTELPSTDSLGQSEPPVAADQSTWEVASVPTAIPAFTPDFQADSRDLAAEADRPWFMEQATSVVQPWLPVATVIWLLGVMLLSLRPLVGCLRVLTLRRSGLYPLSEIHCQLSERLIERLGVPHVVEFAQSTLVEVPTVVGYLRPMVLLPVSTLTGLTISELELVLAHELAHIRRHDYLFNLCQTLIEALLFYHPGMWWVSSQIRQERENCCDDVAVAMSGDRATYIRALAQLEKHRVAPPALAATNGSLLTRVRRLLGEPQLEFGHRKSSILLTIVMTAGITVTVASLVASPSGNSEAAENSHETIEAEANDDIPSQEIPSQEDTLMNFDKLVGQKVAGVVREAKLPFVDEPRLADIEADFAGFISGIPHGTRTVGASVPAKQRQAILTAIEEHGAKHLRIDQFQPGDLRSINQAYLGLPDRLLTMKWKLYQAITHARTLDADKQAKLKAQQAWMRQHIQSLPNYKSFTKEMALSGLEERLADPLCVTLAYPMTDQQFVLFQDQLQKYNSQERELAHVVSHIVQQSLNAQYRDFGDFELPFDDRVVSYGAGRIVHLGFQSNRPFVSSSKSIHEIESSGTVIDATTGNLVTAPNDSREPGAFARWLNEQGKGDFGFDDARDGGLFAVRGAKLVKLEVNTWVEADAISNDELRALLEGPTAGRTVSLKKHYQDYQRDNSPSPCYVGVVTQEGRLAVVAVEDFSGRNSIILRTRARSALPKMVTTELSDNEVTLSFDRPAHWVEREIKISGNALFRICGYRQPTSEADGTIPTIKVEFQDYGHPHSIDVTAKQNPAATINKVLTVAGEPARLISFKIAGVGGQSQPQRELMRLLFGKGTRAYDLTFVYPASQRQQYVELALAVGKSIRIAPNDNASEEVDEPPTGLEFLAGIPEFADLRIGMSEERFKEVIATHKLTIDKDDASSNRRTYTLTTPAGDGVIVMFEGGECRGIQRMRRSVTPKHESQDWGDATHGVQLRIHSPEVREDQGQWKVLCKTDIRAAEERILPHYGAPIDEYAIEWDGKWYREVDRGANVAASVGPSLALERDSMQTVISPDHWVEESTGQSLGELSSGRHTLRIALPLVHSNEIDSKRPLRAVSNEIEVDVPENDLGTTPWGTPNHGVRVRSQLSNINDKQVVTVELLNTSDASWLVEPPSSIGRFVLSDWNETILEAGVQAPLKTEWFRHEQTEVTTIPSADAKILKPEETIVLRSFPINGNWVSQDDASRKLVDELDWSNRSLQFTLPIFPVDEEGKLPEFEDWDDIAVLVAGQPWGVRPRLPLAAGQPMVLPAGKRDHSLRIQGDHRQSGTVTGRVEGDFGPYLVLLEHENWKDKLGELPNLLVKSGETFQFTNVPVGQCTVTAKPTLAINKGKHLEKTLSTTVEVKDGSTATADLLSESEPREQSAPRTSTLPDVDRRDIDTVLDLGSGEFIENFYRSGDFGKFSEIGKGDLWQDGPNAIGTVRGGKIVFPDGRKPIRAEQQTRAYELPELPCQFVVITAEGRSFDVEVTAKNADGLTIQYIEKAIPRVRIDPWEDMEEWLATRAVKLLALQGIERSARGSGDPDLRIAKLYDAEWNGGIHLPDGQSVAEAFYLRYLPRAKTSMERCEIYTQLSVLFSTTLSRELGEEKDLPKAREYARKAIAEEPERISRAIIRARLRTFGSDMPRDEIFQKRLNVYQWLTSWDETSIRDTWTPTRFHPYQKDYYFNVFVNHWKNVTETEAANLVSSAHDDPVKLKQIIDTVPGTEAAERAAEKSVALNAVERAVTETAGNESGRAGERFAGLYQGRLGEKVLTWRILQHNGSYYFKENPDSTTTPDHQKFTLIDGSLVGEDPAERFRFTPDEASGGLIFEKWNKKSGESQGRIALKRMEESTAETNVEESNENTQTHPVPSIRPESNNIVRGLSSRLERIAPKGHARVGDVLHYDLIVKNETDEPIEFDWSTGSMWQPVVDEQTRTIMLMGSFAGSGRVEQQHVVVPPQREKVIHHARYRITQGTTDDTSLPLPLNVTPGDYQILAAGVWGSTPRMDILIRPAARFEVRLTLPEGVKQQPNADSVVWRGEDRQQQTLYLDRQIYLDEDDVIAAKLLAGDSNQLAKVELLFSKEAESRLRAITQTAALEFQRTGVERRLAILLNGKVISASLIEATASNRIVVSGLSKAQARDLLAFPIARSTETDPVIAIPGETDPEPSVVELVISKERGGQISPGGIGYVLDNELITLDKLQERLQQKLKATPNLKLLIRVDPEVQHQAVAVVLRLAEAASVKNIEFAIADG
ncbi:Regulatory protein BlaR1 [Novipirellula aureliae]|uniref:Regulatory protein BlaR1 n=1 Tax=Novipirellula aureliae TaxID=2527966 RepID=A0A5C6EBQ5_9BACT|nr:M56 family metallopeptidase [Novipirellula aureliae]TWU44956.1 Regulatory protein BlaR1 [Novipirellula aureliae]